jgi:hypothetical protein
MPHIYPAGPARLSGDLLIIRLPYAAAPPPPAPRGGPPMSETAGAGASAPAPTIVITYPDPPAGPDTDDEPGAELGGEG